MVRDISGLGSPGRNELRTDRSSNGSPKTADTTSSTPATTGPNASSSDQVELSSQATTLKSLESKLAELPEVDEERVAAIKAAVESGEFNIDNEQLASKILSSDALFGE